jgi:hypothetical protein
MKRAAVLALLLFACAYGVQQEHYRSGAEARAFGAGQRGLLPVCVPDTATNIHMVNDTRSGGVWVWCDLDKRAQSELRATVQKVGWGQAAANTTSPPFTLASPEWNPILGGTLTSTPPAGPLYFVSGAWHGIADPGGRCWITLTAGTKPA